MDELNDLVLRNIFEEIARGSSFENKDIEFKESFGWASMAIYFKAMSGFANARGGFLIFGVCDEDGGLVGLQEEALNRFKAIDGKVWSTNLSHHFHGEIEWDRKIFRYQNRSFAVIYTAPAKKRPIICKNEVHDLKKGAIYYRYAAQTSQIEPADLDTILEEEKRKYLNLVLERVKVMMDAGPENTAVVNLLSGDFTLDSPNPIHVMIDSKTLKEIQFIREGHFTEKEGAPALILKGVAHLVPVERVIATPTPKAITQDDFWRIFLEQKSVTSPNEYLKQACGFSSENFPFFYFLRSCGKTPADAVDFLEAYSVPSRMKGRLIQKFSGIGAERSFHQSLGFSKSPAAKMKQRYAEEICMNSLDVDDPKSQNGKNIRYALQAIRSLDVDAIVHRKEYLLSLLLDIYENEYLNSGCPSSVKTEFRKAVCWVDEALYLRDTSSGD